MKPFRPLRILAIDPGTHHMGVAFFENDSLLYHDVLTINARHSATDILREATSRVGRIIRDLKPNALIFERTFYGKERNEALCGILCEELAALGKKHKLEVTAVSPMTVKKALTGDGHAPKERVAKAVSRRYPELRAYLPGKAQWKKRFHENRFDAVAVGLVVIPRSNGDV